MVINSSWQVIKEKNVLSIAKTCSLLEKVCLKLEKECPKLEKVCPKLEKMCSKLEKMCSNIAIFSFESGNLPQKVARIKPGY